MNKQEFMSQATQEQTARILELRTPEELLALAKEFDVEITKEDASATILKIADFQNKSCELSDDELDAVAGGATYKNGFMVVSCYCSCDYFKKDSKSYSEHEYCCECAYYEHDEGVYLCTNKNNMQK